MLSNPITYWLPDKVHPCPPEYNAPIACTGNLTTISCRITDCNRIRFVSAEYDNDAAVATCVAMRDTHFRIMLFRGETDKDINVVIQKISGCDLIFEEECQALMSAAMFGEIWPRNTIEEDPEAPTDDKTSQNNDNTLPHLMVKEMTNEKKSYEL